MHGVPIFANEAQASRRFGRRSTHRTSTIACDATLGLVHGDGIVFEVLGKRRELGHIEHGNESLVGYQEQRVLVRR